MTRRLAVAALAVLTSCAPGDAVAPVSVLTSEAAVQGDPVQPPPCAPVKLHVRANAKPGGDGSQKLPLTDLRSALELAHKIPCDVGIVLGPGHYAPQPQSAPLIIARSLAIEGQGKPALLEGLRVQTALPVSLRNLAIEGALGTAIRITNKGANVSLEGIRIAGATEYGILQHGGSLEASDVEISNTRTGEEIWTGTAIVITGAARVRLDNVVLRNNPRGLYASDIGTEVDARRLSVLGSTWHPAILSRISGGSCGTGPFSNVGAVEFAHGARGTGSRWLIADSYVVGLYAHTGADVRVSNLIVDETRWLGDAGCGGFGLAVYGAYAEATSFLIMRSELCAVVVGEDGNVDLHRGTILTAPVGACVQNATYDVARLVDDVRLIDVYTPLQSTSYSLPDPGRLTEPE